MANESHLAYGLAAPMTTAPGSGEYQAAVANHGEGPTRPAGRQGASSQHEGSLLSAPNQGGLSTRASHAITAPHYHIRRPGAILPCRPSQHTPLPPDCDGPAYAHRYTAPNQQETQPVHDLNTPLVAVLPPAARSLPSQPSSAPPVPADPRVSRRQRAWIDSIERLSGSRATLGHQRNMIRAVVLAALLRVTWAVLVGTDSPCRAKCGNELQRTPTSDIVCNEDLGTVWQNCLECELTSPYQTVVGGTNQTDLQIALCR